MATEQIRYVKVSCCIGPAVNAEDLSKATSLWNNPVD